mmetsp:Transcript_1003/g.3365  ORF Transcript_1003/g.3365 Transcript_1003/m.3365 type:complete len:201 (-) Transcript_1003:1811-2413(-)
MSPTAVICLNKDLKMPKIELKSTAVPSKFAYPPATELPKEKAKDKVETAVLSTTSKAKAAAAKAKGEQKKKDGEPEAMEVESEAKGDDSKDGDAKGTNGDAKEGEGGEAAEAAQATFTILSNPARVLPPQMSVVELEAGGRYHPVSGSFSFVTVLEDGTPEEPEEFIEMKPPPSAAGDGDVAEAPCPEPFRFDEALEDEA